jgi:hypothetical protein
MSNTQSAAARTDLSPDGTKISSYQGSPLVSSRGKSRSPTQWCPRSGRSRGETDRNPISTFVADYGVSIADLATEIRRNVIAAIERMTGLEVTEDYRARRLPWQRGRQPGPASGDVTDPVKLLDRCRAQLLAADNGAQRNSMTTKRIAAAGVRGARGWRVTPIIVPARNHQHRDRLE